MQHWSCLDEETVARLERQGYFFHTHPKPTPPRARQRQTPGRLSRSQGRFPPSCKRNSCPWSPAGAAGVGVVLGLLSPLTSRGLAQEGPGQLEELFQALQNPGLLHSVGTS